MPSQPHPIDAPPSRSLVAAFLLIVCLGVLALAAQVHQGSGSMRGSWTDPIGTDPVAEFGD